MEKVRIIDLSVTVPDLPPGALMPSEITRISHKESGGARAPLLGVPEDALVDDSLFASEIIKIHTHVGTHLDAPFHFSPITEGKPSKTIDQIPLEWCYGNGVVLDFSHKEAGYLISAEDVQEALKKINYKLKPFDIVLIRTDATKHFGEPDYSKKHPGMSREATIWLIEQGIKVMGIDAWGWDRPFWAMQRDHKPGAKDVLPSHYLGREREYCHLENMANLDQIPKPYGFKVAVFPIKIQAASSGWVRAVAIL
jgi:kynurenine formamidase